ncbi:MAG: polysaccharide deacetylase family protein [Terracidiphilus sp.]
MLDLSYSLRCVVFHHISATQSPFTTGMSVTATPQEFERTLRFLTTHYCPVRLEDVLTNCDGRGLPSRALLVTFDDAYGSVAEYAAPLCKRLGAPAVFFVNAAFLDNQRLAPDNLLCYVANAFGIEVINTAIRTACSDKATTVGSLSDVFGIFLPTLTLAERDAFLEVLRELAGINERLTAQEAGLYLTAEQLRGLKSFDFEIGNHTYTHTYFRSLSPQDFASEIDRNKEELETISATNVRSFSQPYGSSKDLTAELRDHLKNSGHRVVFLSESVANPRIPDLFRLDRINSRARNDKTLFLEIEVLPRLRAIRNQIV